MKSTVVDWPACNHQMARHRIPNLSTPRRFHDRESIEWCASMPASRYFCSPALQRGSSRRCARVVRNAMARKLLTNRPPTNFVNQPYRQRFFRDHVHITRYSAGHETITHGRSVRLRRPMRAADYKPFAGDQAEPLTRGKCSLAATRSRAALLALKVLSTPWD